MYGETDEEVALKVKRAQDVGLNAIVCIGEHLDVRMEHHTNEVLQT